MPCERIHWTLLPSIRKELAKIYVLEMGMKQKAAAKKLGLTEAAVSQYMKNKRGEHRMGKSTKEFLRKLVRQKMAGASIICATCKHAQKI